MGPKGKTSSLWPDQPGRVFGNRSVRVEREGRSDLTPYGGLALAVELVQRLELPRLLDEGLPLLKLRLPYYESDHVLTHVYNLYVGGNCIEDIRNLQDSEAFRSLVGGCRAPDPTTAGDFLRRFGPGDLERFQAVEDAAREKVWAKLPRSRRRLATIDADSTIKPVYGACKEGADFSYTGEWSYHPLLLTLAQTGECLRLVNRPGNAASASGVEPHLRSAMRVARRWFRRVAFRGDSKFYQRATLLTCEEEGAWFAVVMEGFAGLQEIAESLPESRWKRYESGTRERAETRPERRRRPRERLRDRRARERGYRNLRTRGEEVAEFYYQPRWAPRPWRVAVKRQWVEHAKGEARLFEECVYRFLISNIPRCEMNTKELVRFAYGRCDQENAIEQLKNGIGAMRMPTGEFLANDAFLRMGQLAWNVRAWCCLLALPEEASRWEWKRFRQAFVYVAARVVNHARRIVARISAAHRFANEILAAWQRVHSLVFY